MGIGYYNTLVSAQAAGGNLTASLTLTSILPTPCVITLPAGFFEYPGQKLHSRTQGQLGNIVTTPGTITIEKLFGAVVAWNSGALQLGATAHTTLPFWLEVDLTVRAIGSVTAANVMAQGRVTGQQFVVTAGTADTVNGGPTTHATLMAPNTTPAVSSGFSSVGTILIDLQAQFSLNNANAIQVQQYELISCNWGG